MDIRSSAESFRRAADEAVNSSNRQLVWGVFDKYEVRELDDGTDAYLYAPVELPPGLPMVMLTIQPYRQEPWVVDQGLTKYSPLNVSGLFLEFASLVEDPGLDDEPCTERNKAVVLDWISTWGVLGLTPSGFDSLTGRIHQGGSDDTVSEFVKQAGYANATLRLYEAAIAQEGPDIDFIKRGMPEDRWGFYAENPAEARKWALRRVGSIVEVCLEQYCVPSFLVQEDGNAILTWQFRNLLGALWIQMMWLLTSTHQTRCARPGCSKIITFEPGLPPPEPGLKKNPRGKYKTRSDKRFCSVLCRVKNHQQKQKRQAS